MRTDWLAHSILGAGVLLFALPVWLAVAGSTQPADVIARGEWSLVPDLQGLGIYADVLRNGWMHTGDGGYMDEDGYVYVVDRLKDMIVTGGENVYSAEVENVITQLPEVSMCAVVGVPDDRWGERVHAVVVLRSGRHLSETELVAHCRQEIAGYKCPRSVEFRTEIPLSPAGKVLKYKLRESFWSSRDRAVG